MAELRRRVVDREAAAEAAKGECGSLRRQVEAGQREVAAARQAHTALEQQLHSQLAALRSEAESASRIMSARLESQHGAVPQVSTWSSPCAPCRGAFVVLPCPDACRYHVQQAQDVLAERSEGGGPMRCAPCHCMPRTMMRQRQELLLRRITCAGAAWTNGKLCDADTALPPFPPHGQPLFRNIAQPRPGQGSIDACRTLLCLLCRHVTWPLALWPKFDHGPGSLYSVSCQIL